MDADVSRGMPVADRPADAMTRPSKPRSRTSPARRTSRRAVAEVSPEPVGNLAARLRPQPEPAVDTAPETSVEAEPELDPISAGEIAWADASAADRERARADLGTRLTAHLGRGRARIVVTDNLHTMVSIKRGHDVLTFRIHRMFLGAPPAVLRALARYAERQDREAARLLRTYIEANERRIRRRQGPRPIACDVEGKHHQLQEIFDDLNERYFGGEIRAQITWGPRTKRRRGRGSIKLGSYTCEDALIRIHPVLDARDVPRFFVAWIVYHEMLHEIHDMPVVDGRRVYHTADFRRAEARFEEYAEAVLWERTYLHKLLDR